MVPEAGRLRIEVQGALGAILSLAEGAGEAVSGDVLARQVKMVAGTGFEPVTFRL